MAMQGKSPDLLYSCILHQPRRAKTETSKHKPNRPPPPLRPNPYGSNIRRRTNAISMVEGRDHLTPPLVDRYSAPDLAPDLDNMLDSARDEEGEQTGKLISLDTSEEEVRDEKPPSQSNLERKTILEVSGIKM